MQKTLPSLTGGSNWPFRCLDKDDNDQQWNDEDEEDAFYCLSLWEKTYNKQYQYEDHTV